MYDVAIVGARCAGSALALMLARDGLSVVVVDRTVFPSDTLSGHYIQPAGVSCLRRLGLSANLAALGAPAQTRMSVDFGPVVLDGTPAAMPDGTVAGYAPRRFAFDPMLADAAVAAGARLRQGTSFVEPLVEDGRVVGMRTLNPSGRPEDIRARVTIGADGKRSRFARLVGAATLQSAPATTCCYYAYHAGLPVGHARLFVREGRFVVAMPTGEGLTFLAVAWPHGAFADVRRDIGAAYRAAVAEIPWLRERVEAANQVGRFVGTADLDSFIRAPAGEGWALVGDSSHHKDPITAQGMTDALLDAELLADALVRGLSGAAPLSTVLADHGRKRNRRIAPMHRLTADLARLVPPPPQALEAMADMARYPAAVGRFLGVMAGSVPADAMNDPAPAAAA